MTIGKHARSDATASEGSPLNRPLRDIEPSTAATSHATCQGMMVSVLPSDSTLDGVGADLTLTGPPRIDGARGSARLALDELYPWLREQRGDRTSVV